MRLVAVMHLAEDLGPPAHVRPWLNALREADVEVVVPGVGSTAASYRGTALVTQLRYAPLTAPHGVRGTLTLLFAFVREVRMFRDHARRSGADVVFVVTAALPAALVGARLAGTPAIVYAGEILERHESRRRGSVVAARMLVRLTGRLAAVVIATSRAVAAQYDDARADVRVISPGFSVPAEPDGHAFRSRHGLEGASPLLAVVGNITHGRGQDVAIRAVRQLEDRFPDIACAIVGGTLGRPADDEYRETLGKLATELGVSDRVVFTGVVEQIFDVYAAADVVVNPARVPEGLGRAALEALAAGRPVVSSRVGAVPEVLRDGVDALLVEPDEPEAIASAVSTLCEDEELVASLVRHGRQLVLTEFDEKQGAQAFCELVDGVVADRRRSERSHAP